MDLRDWRENYDKYILKEEDLMDNPFEMFNQWMDQAVKDGNPEPNSMVLSTCKDNVPSSRVVLLKEVLDKKYFVFYTNYNSRKGQEMLENPNVSILFYWYHSQRQVRLEGKVTKIDEKSSDEYFNSRPKDSQIASMISPQSKEVSIEELIGKINSVQENEVKRPSHWGGYKVEIDRFEFWQGQPARLHDRFVYEKLNSDNWKIYRLAP